MFAVTLTDGPDEGKDSSLHEFRKTVMLKTEWSRSNGDYANFDEIKNHNDGRAGDLVRGLDVFVLVLGLLIWEEKQAEREFNKWGGREQAPEADQETRREIEKVEDLDADNHVCLYRALIIEASRSVADE